MRGIGVFLMMLLAGCTLGAPARYAGVVDLCGKTTTASLLRNDTLVRFVPGDGVLIIDATLAPDGHFTGMLNTAPPGHAPFVLRIDGTLDRQAAHVTYTTPRCQAAVTLMRAESGLLGL